MHGISNHVGISEGICFVGWVPRSSGFVGVELEGGVEATLVVVFVLLLRGNLEIIQDVLG